MKLNDIFPLYTNEKYTEMKTSAKIAECNYAMAIEVIDKLRSERVDTLDKAKHNTYMKDSIIQYTGGRGRPKALHKFLETDKETDKLYKELTERFINRLKISSPDDLIYKLNLKLNSEYNFTKIYKKDKLEYWLTPLEAYNAVINGDKSKGLDCEDISIFKYTVFKTALKHYNMWDREKERLRMCRVNLIHGENHVMLAWLRGDNDKNVGWFPIESSYHPDLFEKWWAGKVTIDSTNPLYEIQYTWTDEKEYKRL